MDGLGVLDTEKFTRAFEVTVALIWMGRTRACLGGFGAPLWWHGYGTFLRLHQHLNWKRNDRQVLALSMARGAQTKGCRALHLCHFQQIFLCLKPSPWFLDYEHMLWGGRLDYPHHWILQSLELASRGAPFRWYPRLDCVVYHSQWDIFCGIGQCGTILRRAYLAHDASDLEELGPPNDKFFA